MSEETLRKVLPRGLRLVVPDKVSETTFIDLATGAKLQPDQTVMHTFPGITSIHVEVRADELPVCVVQTEAMVEEIQCKACWHTNRWDVFEVLVQIGDSGFQTRVTRVDGKDLSPIAGFEFYADADAEPPYLILHEPFVPSSDEPEPSEAA
jgi:hypothetical protein